MTALRREKSGNVAALLPDEVQQVVKGANCFDFLRYFFAFMLIVAHFCTLTNIDQLFFISGGLRVKAFFVITGFLVSFSFIRRNGNLKSYFMKRFVRIVPAYLCTIVFCFLIGLWLTDLSAGSFLSSSSSWRYLAVNAMMLNWLQPDLPGVFLANPLPQMNGALWSMKLEVLFYIIVPMLLFLAAKWGKRLLLPILFVAVVGSYSFLQVQGQYFTFFIGGMTVLLLFQYHSYLKYLIWVCVPLMVLPYMVNYPLLEQCIGSLEPYLFAITLVGVAYILSFLSFFRRLDNITYGLYLYHFPVIQVLVHYRLHERSIVLTLILAVLITAILATLSWKLIEQPLMNKYK